MRVDPEGSEMKTKDLVLVALFAAVIVVLAALPPVVLPWVPVPITLQTFGVMLTGLVLGPRRAALVLVLYVTLALIGLPVLPGGRAGLAVLMGPTGGFLLGMIPGAFVVGYLSGAFKAPGPGMTGSIYRDVSRCFLASVVGGILVVYLFGVPWLAIVAKMGFTKALLAVTVFLPGDFIKAAVAAFLAHRIRRTRLIQA